MAPEQGIAYHDGMFGELTVEELKQKLDRENHDNLHPISGFALLAVVNDEEFRHAHIPGAMQMRPADLESCIGRYERDKQIVIYAENAEDSREKADELRQLGFRRVLPLIGDVHEWLRAGFTVISRRRGFRPAPEQSAAIGDGAPIESGVPIDERSGSMSKKH